MIAVTHLRLPVAAALETDGLLLALSGRPGFVRGTLGRSMDVPEEWVLVTEWDAVGSYRRGLSAYEVKLAFAPVMAYVRDESSAYETVTSR